jgi:DNA-binding beta-propeller fold protein YncE
MKTYWFSVLTGLLATAAGAADFQYQLIHTIPVGGAGGWDYLSVDDAARRLYVSHADKIVVIDMDLKTVIGEITNTPGVHGLAVCLDQGVGVTSNGRENTASIVDLNTLQTLAKVNTASGPDGMLYNPAAGEAYLFCGRARAATVVDVKARQAVATIPLAGKPEFGVADPAADRIYDNIEDKSEVTVIDGRAHKVVANWPTAPGEEPSGLALDAKNHHLFIGCRNQRLVMMDATNGKILSTLPMGAGVDACAYDPHIHLVFASCGDGTTTIARLNEDQTKLTLLQTLSTEPGARTMAVDPVEHNLYLATAKFAPATKGQHYGQVIPGTFKILVYGPR